jgi:hypothetical protein
MSAIPRIVLAPVEYVPVLSIRFALRLTLCLFLTAFNVGAIAFAVPPLYHATARHPFQVFGVGVLFMSLLGSLVRVWSVAMRTYRR